MVRNDNDLRIAGAVGIEPISEAAIRWQLFNKDTNGLAKSGSIIRNGRRVLIDLPAYVNWLRNGGIKDEN